MSHINVDQKNIYIHIYTQLKIHDDYSCPVGVHYKFYLGFSLISKHSVINLLI